MLIHVPNLLTPQEVAQLREVLGQADWADGRITAGTQSAQAKKNLQVPENTPAHRAMGEAILTALGKNERFTSAALPLRVFPPQLSRPEGATPAVMESVIASVLGGTRWVSRCRGSRCRWLRGLGGRAWVWSCRFG